jgi:hypothetical protein
MLAGWSVQGADGAFTRPAVETLVFDQNDCQSQEGHRRLKFRSDGWNENIMACTNTQSGSTGNGATQWKSAIRDVTVLRTYRVVPSQ